MESLAKIYNSRFAAILIKGEKKMQKIIIKPVLGFIMLSLFLVACSNDDDEKSKQEPSVDTTREETMETNDQKVDSDSEESEDNEKREHIENQEGLQIGETGTVVSSKEKYTYEVTLNEVRYQDIEELKLFDEVFMVTEVTIKNIDDRTIDAEDIFTPTLGESDTNEYQSPVGNEFQEGISGITNIEGEILPGDSVTGHFVYDMKKADKYHFAFGTNWDHITTMVEWEFSEDEME